MSPSTDPVSTRPVLGRPTRVRRLQTAAMLLCAVCLFYGVLGVGSTLIVWFLIEFDATRPDFYLSLFAAAGAGSYLLHLLREHSGRANDTRVALALNGAWIVCAVVVGLMRGEMLTDAALRAVLALLLVTPIVNITALLVVRRAH